MHLQRRLRFLRSLEHLLVVVLHPASLPWDVLLLAHLRTRLVNTLELELVISEQLRDGSGEKLVQNIELHFYFSENKLFKNDEGWL